MVLKKEIAENQRDQIDGKKTSRRGLKERGKRPYGGGERKSIGGPGLVAGRFSEGKNSERGVQ